MKNLKLLCLEVALFLEKSNLMNLRNIVKGHHLNNQKCHMFIVQKNT